jgi:hypothetical protein
MPMTTSCPLRSNAGEPLVQTLMKVRQLGVIEAHQVQNRGVQI